MNKLNIKFVIPTCSLLILTYCQVSSQNHHLYRFIINKLKQRATFALTTLVKEELHDGEEKVEFNTSMLHSL